MPEKQCRSMHWVGSSVNKFYVLRIIMLYEDQKPRPLSMRNQMQEVQWILKRMMIAAPARDKWRD